MQGVELIVKCLKKLPEPDSNEEIKLEERPILPPYESAVESEHEDLPKVLNGDERRFKQVLINLLKNALKFTQTGSITLLISYDSLLSKLSA